MADCAYNAGQIIALMEQAEEQHVKVLVLPELCVTGYTCGDLFLQDTLLDGAMDALRARIAEKLKGTLLVAPEVRLVEPGGIERAIGKAKHVDDRREK